jgi:hypothetical protein
MQGSDFDGKRVSYMCKEWLVTGLRIGPIDCLTLTEAGQPVGQQPDIIEVTQHRWNEIEILGDG